MKPAPFEYHAPESLADVVALLAEHGDEAKVLAGGQSLVPMLALRLTRFEHLVDLNRVDDLRGVAALATARLTIGAMTTQRTVEHDADRGRGRPAARAGHRRSSATSRSATAARSAGRSPTPTRRRSTRPSRSRSTPSSRSPARAAPARIPASEFFLGTWTTSDGAPTSSSARCTSPCGRATPASRSRRSHAARRLRARRASSPRSRSTATAPCHARGLGVPRHGSDAVRAERRPSRRSSAASPTRRRPRGDRPPRGGRRRPDRRRPRVGRVPQARRRAPRGARASTERSGRPARG